MTQPSDVDPYQPLASDHSWAEARGESSSTASDDSTSTSSSTESEGDEESVPAVVDEVVAEAAAQPGNQENDESEGDHSTDPSDMSWVSQKMKGYKSLYGPGHPALDDLQQLFRKPGWSVKGMREDEDITIVPSTVKFTMHTVVFEKMKIVPPFTSFQRTILGHLGVAPSQLHPNGWGFLKAFEQLSRRLGRRVSPDLFLAIFELSWHGEYGTNMARKEQVSFKHQKGFPRKIFKAFSDSLGAGWKSKYFWVVPNVEAAASVCEVLPSGDAGAPYFPFSWRAAHFEKKPSDYTCSVSVLDEEDKETLATIQHLADLLPRNPEGVIPCRPFCLYAGEELLEELGKTLKMSANDWRNLERLAKGAATPVGPKRAADVASQGTPGGFRQKGVSSGPSRSTAEMDRSPKRQRREQEMEPVFEVENLGPRNIEDLKNDPLSFCGDICRDASKLMKDLKMESINAQKEKEAALKRLAELEPQLEEARKARRAADDDRAKMSKRIKDLMGQNKTLQDQVVRAEEEKEAAVAVELKRVAEMAKGAAIHQFNNAVAQMQVFNVARGARFDEKIVNPSHEVEGCEIVLPQEVDDEGKVVRARVVVFGRSPN